MSTKPANSELLESQVIGLLDLQRELLEIVSQGDRLTDRLDRICRLFERAVDGMVATIMRLDPRTGRLNFISAPSAPGDLLDALDEARLGEGNGSCAYAAFSGKPTYVEDAVHDPHWSRMRRTAERFGVQSCWSAPVRDREHRVCGTFALTSLNSSLPDGYQRQLLDLGAISVGLLFDQEHEDIARKANDRTIRRLALIADSSPNGILFTGPDQQVEWSNAGAHQLLERTAPEVRGQPLHRVLGLKPRDTQLRAMLDALERDEPFAGTLQLRRASGKRWVAQTTCTPSQEHEAPASAIMLVDVTALQRLSEFNILLAKVDHALSRASRPDQLLQSICDLTVRHAGLSLAWIGRPDPETGWFRFLAASGPGRGYLDEIRISSRPDLPEGRGPCGATWDDGKARFDCSFEHTSNLKPWAQAAREHGFAAIAVLPIRRGGQLWAELAVYHSELDSFDETLQQLLDTLAVNISTGLDRFDLAHRESESKALNESMLDSATVGVMLTRNRVVLRANRRAAEILGASDPRELEGVNTVDFYADPEVGASITQQVRQSFKAKRRAILQIEARRLDGKTFWMRLEGAPFPHEGYDEIWSLIDETEQHRALDTQRLLANALASVQEGVILTDARQRTVYTNEAFHALTGYTSEQMRGRNCNLLQGPDSDPRTIGRIREALSNERGFVGEILNYRRDGSRFWNLLTINPLRDEKGRLTHFVGIQRDITDLRELNDRLEHLAFHDELTGLPNRRALDRHFSKVLPQVANGRQMLAVGIMDLDDFKVINDTHGHACGDRLLKDVAERIRPLMHEQDFFARLGGDEFVVVLHEKGRYRMEKRLQKRYEDIGARFRKPFEIGLDQPIHAEVSMGVALSPKHADAGGMLLRLADEALFQAKRHKRGRTRWWAVYNDTHDPEPAISIRPYGDPAADLLSSVQAQLDGLIRSTVDAFYERLDADPEASHLLRMLSSDDLDELKRRQQEHLRFLLDGATSQRSLHEAGTRLGRMHALMGLDSIGMMRWMSVYQDALIQRSNALPLDTRSRYHLVQLLDHRLQDNLKAQMHGQSSVQDRYAAIIDQVMPERGAAWNDAITREIRLLARLPGITCAMVLRQNSSELFDIESSSGASAREVSAILREAYQNAQEAGTLEAPESSLMAQAWQELRVHTVVSVKQASGLLPESLAQAGTHAATAIPILDDNHLPVALLLLFGRFPRQFDSKYMQHFTRNLQLRGNEIWQRSMRPPPPVPYEQGVALRRRLFKDGLRILLQPVVDLHDGRLVKAEALARLELEDGTLVGPDTFLPLLRHTELNTLFRRGLDLALGELVELERQGVTIDMAVNIAPHTLSEPECVKWVVDTLDAHGVAPQRLVLEILENQRVDRQSRDAVVNTLVAHGVRFAIDDLGSGYSSLRRLASLPFDSVKVDQGLMSRVHVDPVQSVSLISAVVQIGRDFGCQVIAEGLESDGMIEMARLLGASMGQGYAIARPMPAADLPAWNRGFTLRGDDGALHTALGGLAFQWVSLRHGSLHGPSLEACPLSRLMQSEGGLLKKVSGLHAGVHENPGDKEAARRLLEGIQACIRERTAPESDAKA